MAHILGSEQLPPVIVLFLVRTHPKSALLHDTDGILLCLRGIRNPSLLWQQGGYTQPNILFFYCLLDKGQFIAELALCCYAAPASGVINFAI